MSDKTAFNALENSPISGATRGRPGAIHEELYSQLIEDVMTRVMEFVPTMGQVTGKDGGKVVVWTDDEDEPRQFGFSRKRGEKFEPGQRVMVQKTRSGEMVVTGGISGKDGRDEAVDNDQLYDDAVDNRNLRNQAVDTDQIAGNAVSWQKLKSDAQQRVNDALEAGKEGQRLANNAQNKADNADTKAGQAQNRADNAFNNAGQAQNDANTAKNKADAAQSTANNVQNDINGQGGIKSDITNIKGDISAMKADIKKLQDKANSGA